LSLLEGSDDAQAGKTKQRILQTLIPDL